METNGQRNTGPVSDAAGQDSKAAEHMAMDILGLCGIFRFLKEFFMPGIQRPSLDCLTPSPTRT